MAAKLDNVRVLGYEQNPEGVTLKLQTHDGPPDSYFFLEIIKSDPKSFEKLVQVMNKVYLKDSYQLDLNIPSFSDSPSGSYYRSPGITFGGPEDREPNGSKSSAKKKPGEVRNK
jgi:hypothetical protein